MRLLPLALVLVGCGGPEPIEIPEEPCITPNRMMLLGSLDCVGLVRAEAAALRAIHVAVPEYRDEDLGSRLLGVRVSVLMPGDTERDHYIRYGERDCYGLYRFTAKEIVLANDYWATNSLTHEMLHALEGMNLDHAGWEERGFYAAADLGKSFYVWGVQ